LKLYTTLWALEDFRFWPLTSTKTSRVDGRRNTVLESIGVLVSTYRPVPHDARKLFDSRIVVVDQGPILQVQNKR
jgi:hypothetical protein